MFKQNWLKNLYRRTKTTILIIFSKLFAYKLLFRHFRIKSNKRETIIFCRVSGG